MANWIQRLFNGDNHPQKSPRGRDHHRRERSARHRASSLPMPTRSSYPSMGSATAFPTSNETRSRAGLTPPVSSGLPPQYHPSTISRPTDHNAQRSIKAVDFAYVPSKAAFLPSIDYDHHTLPHSVPARGNNGPNMIHDTPRRRSTSFGADSLHHMNPSSPIIRASKRFPERKLPITPDGSPPDTLGPIAHGVVYPYEPHTMPNLGQKRLRGGPGLASASAPGTHAELSSNSRPPSEGIVTGSLTHDGHNGNHQRLGTKRTRSLGRRSLDTDAAGVSLPHSTGNPGQQSYQPHHVASTSGIVTNGTRPPHRADMGMRRRSSSVGGTPYAHPATLPSHSSQAQTHSSSIDTHLPKHPYNKTFPPPPPPPTLRMGTTTSGPAKRDRERRVGSTSFTSHSATISDDPTIASNRATQGSSLYLVDDSSPAYNLSPTSCAGPSPGMGSLPISLPPPPTLRAHVHGASTSNLYPSPLPSHAIQPLSQPVLQRTPVPPYSPHAIGHGTEGLAQAQSQSAYTQVSSAVPTPLHHYHEYTLRHPHLPHRSSRDYNDAARAVYNGNFLFPGGRSSANTGVYSPQSAHRRSPHDEKSRRMSISGYAPEYTIRGYTYVHHQYEPRPPSGHTGYNRDPGLGPNNGSADVHTPYSPFTAPMPPGSTGGRSAVRRHERSGSS